MRGRLRGQVPLGAVHGQKAVPGELSHRLRRVGLLGVEGRFARIEQVVEVRVGAEHQVAGHAADEQQLFERGGHAVAGRVVRAAIGVVIGLGAELAGSAVGVHPVEHRVGGDGSHAGEFQQGGAARARLLLLPLPDGGQVQPARLVLQAETDAGDGPVFLPRRNDAEPAVQPVLGSSTTCTSRNTAGLSYAPPACVCVSDEPETKF